MDVYSDMSGDKAYVSYLKFEPLNHVMPYQKRDAISPIDFAVQPNYILVSPWGRVK